MIEIKKNSREIYFFFSIEDACDFLNYLKDLPEKGEVVFDAIDMTKGKIIKIWFLKNDAEEAKVSKNGIKMLFTDDAIEYAEFKINEFIKVGYISPAEFFEFASMSDSSKKKSIRTYFMIKEH